MIEGENPSSLLSSEKSYFEHLSLSLKKYFDLPGKSMSSTFGNRNIFSMYLCFTIPAAILSIFLVSGITSKSIYFIILLINMSALVVTRARASWLGIFLCILIFIYLYRRYLIATVKQNFKKKWLLSATIILLFFVFVSIRLPSFKGGHKKSVFSTIGTISKIWDKDAWSSSVGGYRYQQYESTVRMIKDHLITGVGIENWRIIYSKYSGYIINDENYLKLRQRPHNDFLWTTAEVGILGMIAIMVFFLAHSKLAFKSLNKLKNNASELQLINTFIIMSFIAIIVESMFDFPKQRTMPNLFMWSSLGFLSTQFVEKEKVNEIYGRIIKWVLVLVFGVVSIWAYKDYKSNIYSQDLRYLKDKQEYNSALQTGLKALNYGRNVDNTGTPVAFYMGISEYKLGHRKKALSLFSDALSISPYYLGALENYMILSAEEGKLDTAFAYMEKLQQVYPNYFSPRLNMTKLYMQSENIPEAMRILTEVKNGLINKDQKIYKSVIKETDRLLSMFTTSQNDEN